MDHNKCIGDFFICCHVAFDLKNNYIFSQREVTDLLHSNLNQYLLFLLGQDLTDRHTHLERIILIAL